MNIIVRMGNGDFAHLFQHACRVFGCPQGLAIKLDSVPTVGSRLTLHGQKLMGRFTLAQFMSEAGRLAKDFTPANIRTRYLLLGAEREGVDVWSEGFLLIKTLSRVAGSDGPTTGLDAVSFKVVNVIHGLTTVVEVDCRDGFDNNNADGFDCTSWPEDRETFEEWRERRDIYS